MKKFIATLLFLAVPAAGLEAQPIDKVFADSVRRHETVPGTGIAVAVLKDGKLFYTGALGLRDRAANAPVTVDTVFPIGSSTKAFTSMALAILAERKGVALDAPVRQYLADFFMQDQAVQASLTLEDILSHRTGLAAHNALWVLGPFNRVQLAHRLRYLDPNALPGHGYRRSFEYNNLTYSAAAYVLEAVTGDSWDSFVKANIFDPLQMQVTSLKLAEMLGAPNHAKPYQGGQVLTPFDLDNIAPAGAINSNVRDLANWVHLHLNRGLTPAGAKIVDPASLEKMYDRYIDVNPARGVTYGLGWFVVRKQGRRMVHHGGNALGYTALVSMLPDHGVGMAVLTNQDRSALPLEVSCDLYLHLLPQIADAFCATTRVAHMESIDLMPAARAEAGSAAAKLRATPLAMPPTSDYTGMYSHAGYGDVSVSVRGGNLQLSYYKNSWLLKPFDRDLYYISVEAYGASYPVLMIVFDRTASGQVEKLTIPFEPTVGAIRFVKR